METLCCFDDAASIVTRCPGRLRIAVPTLHRSPLLQQRIEAALSQRAHIREVHASPLTGKVLVLFDLDVSPERMAVMLGLRLTDPQAQERTRDNPDPPAQPVPSYPPWHLRPAEAALAFHGSSAQSGLSIAIAEQRLRMGANVLPQQRGRSGLAILLGQFKSTPVALLGLSAALSLVTGGLSEAIAIAAVLAMNAGIGYVSERGAEETIASLSDLVDASVPVVRDGKTQEVASSRIVAGDLIVLAPGVRVAADARLLQASGLAVDESTLTGESQFVAKSSAALDNAAAIGDRINMVYMGTVVAAGSGLAVVVGTGIKTELGVIQRLMQRTGQPPTPLQKQLDALGNRLVAASLFICLAILAVGLLRGLGGLRIAKSVLSLAIAAVPEGLPTVATATLARGVLRMRAKNMLVRRLQAVETLGAIHTICLDKTGTLTMNRMMVTEVQTGTQQFGTEDAGMARLLQVCALCNESEVCNNGSDKPLFSGSSTENALTEFATGRGTDVRALRARHALLRAELRAEERNYMKTVRAMPESTQRFIAVKGSPDEVLRLCGYRHCGNDLIALSEEHRQEIAMHNARMAERQLRVLGFAYAEAEDDTDSALTWAGLVGLADPVRAGAQQVIAALHDAGVRTAMVTGDQSKTAYAVGKTLALRNGDEPTILDAQAIELAGADELPSLVAQADIFARVSPARKLQIVQALRANGAVVAMTGDGINDGPALRAADVGIAMGLHGTDLARSAADVVLTDDRLDTVLDAIHEGRTITVNILKSLHFLISSNLSEIIAVFGAVAAGAPSPFSPLQLLWLNLLSDVLPAVALAAEPAEQDLMRRPPREAGKPMIGRDELMQYGREGFVLAAGGLAAYAYGLARHGQEDGRAGSLAFNTLILGQLLHALSCRSDSQPWHAASGPAHRNRLNQAIAGSVGLHVLANLLPALTKLLATARPDMLDLLVTLAGAIGPLLLNERRKMK